MKHEVTCQELNDEQLEQVVGGQAAPPPTVICLNMAVAIGNNSNNAAFAYQANQLNTSAAPTPGR